MGYKMKGSPYKHYTGSHKGAKKHPAHKISDLWKGAKDLAKLFAFPVITKKKKEK